MATDNNTGTVTGKVITADNTPAADVTVHLKGTKKMTITEEDGSFSFSNLQPGSYELEASLVGFEPVTISFNIEKGQRTAVALQIKATKAQLQEVIITGEKRKFTRTQSRDVAKMPLKNLENPQIYTTVPKELMQDQVISVYADALKNVPGVVMQLENNSAGGTVTSRGFSTQSFLRNGVPGIVGGGTIDPVNIESIEAIKGPSGALYGSSLISFGGLFNRVTKKPFENFRADLSYTAGGFGLSRATADINTPLNADKTLLLRVNAAKHDEASFQDAGFKNYVFVAPSLTYKLNDRTTVSMDLDFQHEKANSFYRLFADGAYTTGVRSPKDLKIDFNKHFTGDDIAITTNMTNLYLRVDHELSSHWHSQTSYTYLSNNASGANGYMSLKAGNDSLIRNVSWYEYNNASVTDLQQNFTADGHIGKLRNRLLVGAEFYSIINKVSTPGNVAFDVLSASKPGAAYTALTRSALLDKVKNMAFSRNRAQQNTYSAYIQDVFNITEQLIVMASVRVDRFENRGTYSQTRDTTTGKYSQTAVSPKFGLVYQLIPEQLSIFGNYMNGFQNIAPVSQPDGTTSSFKPSQANQWEAGVKVSVLDNRIMGSVSYYDIKVSNITRADQPSRPTYTVQDGSQDSKGMETEFTVNPFTGLTIVAGYAYNDSKYRKINPTLDGFRPSSAGPVNTVNWWLSYRLKGVLKGAGLGFGGNYASENKVILSSTSLYSLPAYTVLGASVSYEQTHYRISAKLDNLTGEKYWVGWSTTIPQMPARFSASIALKF
jgi:iron complex outermembrane receptor protein